MKFSFSTKGWHGKTFEEFCDIAEDLGFNGVELHNVGNKLFKDKNGAFYDYAVASTLRRLYEKKLCVCCMDAISDISTVSDFNDISAVEEICKCLSVAENLRIPFVRLKAAKGSADNAVNLIRKLLPEAENSNVTFLLETAGVFKDTALLRETLDGFASDNLAALWNLSETFIGDESPEITVKNLGAYIKHVVITDVVKNGCIVDYRLMGQGDLPIKDIMRALRSINYDGFISLVWNPEWEKDVSDYEIIFSQFLSFMKQFGDTSRNEKTLYYNRAHTGKYVWKKELLINETFPQVLDRMAEEFPDQYAFKYTTLDYTRTYQEFREDVDEFARALIAMGVKAGAHVAVWATNVPEWYIAFWATTKIGAVLVTVNTAYKIHEAEYLLKQSDAHTLIMVKKNLDSDYSAIINELCPELSGTRGALHSKRLPFLRNVITVGFKMKGATTWADALKYADRVPVEEVYRRAAAINKDDVCNMQYTSGTTGFPKGVMLTHYNIVNNGKCIGDRMDLSTADKMMIQVPMFHCFGMVLAMTATMTHGGTCLPLPYFSPKASLSCINNEGITAFHGVPTMFIAMLAHPDFKNTDFSHMRTGIMAGSPCPISAMNDVVNKMNMKEITIVYGQTEASPGCTMSFADDPIDVRVSTVGRPLPEIECKIVNPENGKECAVNETGEFVARGYNIMKGYYKMPKETASAIDEAGWLHTGDLACKTEDGNYRITGRLKDMIIRGGENIYPKELEEFIYTHPKVKDVQVIGIPDKQYGEEILAAIVLKEGETMTAEEMQDFVKTHMARHKVPRYIDFVEGFPMNAAGKILKYKMREDAVKKLGLKEQN